MATERQQKERSAAKNKLSELLMDQRINSAVNAVEVNPTISCWANKEMVDPTRQRKIFDFRGNRTTRANPRGLMLNRIFMGSLSTTTYTAELIL